MTDPGEIAGYTDYADYTAFVHLNTDTNNFVEKMGEREILGPATTTAGPWAAQTIPYNNIITRKLGTITTVQLAALSVTASSGSAPTITLPAGTIPAYQVPANATYVPCVLTNNALNVPGIVLVGTDGSLNFSIGGGTNFTNAAAAGWPNQQFHYYSVV